MTGTDVISRLRLERIEFAYRAGADPVVSDVTFDFRAGAVTAITGESGRGKSTLLYILGLLLTPSSGRVLLDDLDVASLSDAHRSRVRNAHIGFVFQDAALDASRTVLDAVVEPTLYAGEGRDAARGRALGLLERLGVGLRSGHRPGEISGGQAQRVAICRALINDPAIILADEPTGNLDRANSDLVLDALAADAAVNERTVIIATHDPYVVARSDEVLAL